MDHGSGHGPPNPLYDRLPKFAEYMQGLGLEVFEKILSDINNLEKVVKNDKE